MKEEDFHRIADQALAAAQLATRCASHSSLNHASPGSLAFGRDMILNIPFHADLIVLQQHRQQLIDKRLLRANAKRLRHEYKVDDLVSRLDTLPPAGDKLGPTAKGPFKITRVHHNGAVTIALDRLVRE